MSRKGTNPDPPADAVKPDPPPAPPRPELACDKCGTVLTSEKDAYWHGRRDSAGCVHTLMGMVLDLHGRLELIEGALAKAAAPSSEEERTA